MKILHYYYKYQDKVNYLVVGGWNTLFSYLVFAGLYYVFNKIMSYAIILVINYVIGITNAYLCYKFFVFKTKGNYLREYFRFYLVYGVAFLINLLLFPLFVNIFKIQPLISQAIINLFTIIISYLAHKNFSFNKANWIV